MSLVFSCAGDMTEWKPISEVPELKAEVVKIAMEEQASEAAMQFSESNNEIKKLLVFDMYGDSVERPTPTLGVEVASSMERKSFVADNGIRYCWDEGEQDWVEDDGEIEVDEPEPEKSKGTKRDLEMDESDSEDEDNHEGEDTKQQKGDLKAESKGSSDEKKEEEKKKRKNRKKKKRKGPNHWIYITGLPKDITFEEVKNHFSKVRFISFACRVFFVSFVDGLVRRWVSSKSVHTTSSRRSRSTARATRAASARATAPSATTRRRA